jgi:hypothetical protein
MVPGLVEMAVGSADSEGTGSPAARTIRDNKFMS